MNKDEIILAIIFAPYIFALFVLLLGTPSILRTSEVEKEYLEWKRENNFK